MLRTWRDGNSEVGHIAAQLDIELICGEAGAGSKLQGDLAGIERVNGRARVEYVYAYVWLR
jgi:hypothetical protein